jgi:hypothetical protein
VSEKNEQANAANQAPVARQFSAGGNLAIHRWVLPENLEMILHLMERFELVSLAGSNMRVGSKKSSFVFNTGEKADSSLRTE